MTDAIAQALIAAAQQELPPAQAPIVVKYFTPDAAARWFIVDGLLERDLYFTATLAEVLRHYGK